MRKFDLIALAALAIAPIASQAQTQFANPKDAEGNYIVKWDPQAKAFAESNDWEVDETFIFAVDITGTGIEDKIAAPSRNPSILGRTLAYDLYVTSAEEGASGKGNIDGRLIHIQDNVYGMTINFFQQHVTRFADNFFGPNEDFSDYKVLEPGFVTSWNANLFAIGWTEDNPGAEWWDAVAPPVCGEFPFSSAPYTGKKTCKDFFYGDATPADACPLPGLDPGAYHSMCDSWGGYEDPKYYDDVYELINPTSVGTMSAAAVVGSTYYDLQGRRLSSAPAKGLYIRSDLRTDGTSSVVKVVK